MKIIILILIMMSSHPIIFSKEINSFSKLDSLWNEISYVDHFSEQFSTVRYNDGLMRIELSDFFYYRKIEKYLNSKFNSENIILRIINAQQYSMYWPFVNCDYDDYFYSPDVCFLYKKNKYKDLHLVYWDKKAQKVVDTLLKDVTFDINYLLKKDSYEGLEWNGFGEVRNWNIGSRYGTGVSLSVYNKGEVFVVSLEEFWKNSTDEKKIEFFNSNIIGKNETINQLKKMLLFLRDYVKFEDFAKDRVTEAEMKKNCEEYEKIRNKIIDVKAIEEREKKLKEKK